MKVVAAGTPYSNASSGKTVQIPKNLSAEELALYKKLNEISTNNVRDNFYDK